MIEYEVDNNRKLIIERCRGAITIDDILNLNVNDLVEPVKGSEYRFVLIDIRFAGIKQDSREKQNMLLEQLKHEVAKFRFVLIVGSIEQLFSDLGLELRNQFKDQLKAFTSFEDAINWIDINDKLLNCE